MGSSMIRFCFDIHFILVSNNLILKYLSVLGTVGNSNVQWANVKYDSLIIVLLLLSLLLLSTLIDNTNVVKGRHYTIFKW